MRTKINNFYNFLTLIEENYEKFLTSQIKDEDNFIKEIKVIYSTNIELFPSDLIEYFVQYHDENGTSKKEYFGYLLKVSFHNLKKIIEFDYQFIRKLKFTDEFIKLFYFYKTLSYNFYTVVSAFCFMYYGKYKENRIEKTIRIKFLNYYKTKKHLFRGLSNKEIIHNIHLYYSENIELLDLEIKKIYTNNNFTLEIIPIEEMKDSSLETDLELLNKSAMEEIKLLQDYPINLIKFSRKLKFNYPDFLTHSEEVLTKNKVVTEFEKSNVLVKFIEPENVYKSLVNYLNNSDDEENLKNLLLENVTPSNKIQINSNANTIIYFFKSLKKDSYLVSKTNADISLWIIKNFLFFHNKEYKIFKKDTVQKTLDRDGKVPHSKILYLS